jgi:hypothetical protein
MSVSGAIGQWLDGAKPKKEGSPVVTGAPLIPSKGTIMPRINKPESGSITAGVHLLLSWRRGRLKRAGATTLG